MILHTRAYCKIALPSSSYPLVCFSIFVLIGFTRCGESVQLPPGDPDNGGLVLPGDFEAVVVADSVGRTRHLAVNDNGDIYVKLRVPHPKGMVALRDTTQDGKADIIQVFGDYNDEGDYGTAMRIHNGYLYFSTAGEVYRTQLTPEKLIPESKVELILTDDYKNDEHGYEHIAKPLAFDDQGNMYVPFGAPGDVCQEFNRTPGSVGLNPCPQLEEHGGIWQFDANKPGQTQKDGQRYATGIRSAVAMDWNHTDSTLYVLQHGRDSFTRQWPELYTAWQSALLPSEEFLQVKEGTDAGWPYYYYDQIQGKKLLNPEYGGDGKKEGEGMDYEQPIIGFPGHMAPNDLFFYTGDQFPERYKNGAFIAFHGSTIRAPYPQAGYFVAFVPFHDGAPSGPWEVFADGFAGVEPIINTGDAAARPMGIAMGPDGSLYISESVKGKLWRIMYKGDKNEFGTSQLAKMEDRKLRANLRTPDKINDDLAKGIVEAGARTYNNYCISCHQGDGKGDGSRFPSLAGSEWVIGDKERLIGVIVNGLEGPITVKNQHYNGIMPSHSFLNDQEIAAVLTYIRQNFDNDASGVQAIEVNKVRKSTAEQTI